MAQYENSSRGNTFFGGAAILAFGIMIVKIIGMFYKIPLINIIGEQGAADFNNAYNIYAVLLTVSTAGLPVAVSKLVSEARALGNYNQMDKIFRTSLCVFLTLGTCSFLLMNFYSQELADMMNDSMAAPGIRALAPAVICVGCLSAFRGYFQGQQNMTPTAVSQIIEALTKLFLGLGLATFIMGAAFTVADVAKYRPELDTSGMNPAELEQAISATQTSIAAAGAISGVTIGTIFALIFMVGMFVFSRMRRTTRGSDRPDGNGKILTSILKISVPITLSSAMVGIVTVIDASLVQGQLQNALGMTENASRILYGNYSGALNLYNLPLSLVAAITISVIPAVSSARAKHDKKAASRITGSALRLTAILTFPMGVGLIVMGTPIIQLIFPTLNAEIAGPLLSSLGVSSLFVCLMLVCNSVLQANGFVNLPVIIMLVGGLVKIITNYQLVAIPSIGIYGAPIGNIFCFGITLLLDLILIARVVPGRPSYTQAFLKPAIAATIMGFAAWAIYGLSTNVMSGMELFQTVDGLSRSGNTLATLGAIGIAAILYLVLVVLLRAISRDDLALMPKGDKIAKFLKI